MQAVVERLRSMIGDKSLPQHFSGDDLQGNLDSYRERVRYHSLCPIPTYTPSGTQYLEFQSEGVRYWEGGVTVCDASYNALESADADLINGIWTFDVHQANGVLVSGFTFDMNAAAADSCDQWAAALSRSFDSSDSEQRMMRSQMAKSLREQAAQFRQGQKAGVGTAVRSDAN